MVNEYREADRLSEDYEEKVLSELSYDLSMTNLNEDASSSERDQDSNLDSISNSNRNHFYSNVKVNFFKDYKMALDSLLEKLDNQASSSIIDFQKESMNLINKYIDQASVDYNNTLESIRQRYERISNQSSKCINLFNNLISDREDLEIELLGYLNY